MDRPEDADGGGNGRHMNEPPWRSKLDQETKVTEASFVRPVICGVRPGVSLLGKLPLSGTPQIIRMAERIGRMTGETST